uniref:Uncharacterized protein n=1 Tax=Cacopsylla melanoneura TaxID=428564 RepID=A0A8D9BI02_9HEMI
MSRTQTLTPSLSSIRFGPLLSQVLSKYIPSLFGHGAHGNSCQLFYRPGNRVWSISLYEKAHGVCAVYYCALYYHVHSADVYEQCLHQVRSLPCLANFILSFGPFSFNLKNGFLSHRNSCTENFVWECAGTSRKD